MLRKKAFVAVSSRNNQNQVCLSITWFLTGTKAQLRAVTYNELVWPVFMPFPFFFCCHVSVPTVCIVMPAIYFLYLLSQRVCQGAVTKLYVL